MSPHGRPKGEFPRGGTEPAPSERLRARERLARDSRLASHEAARSAKGAT
jgi:hypothetical protein